jgi:hypothetical protein
MEVGRKTFQEISLEGTEFVPFEREEGRTNGTQQFFCEST